LWAGDDLTGAKPSPDTKKPPAGRRGFLGMSTSSLRASSVSANSVSANSVSANSVSANSV